MSKNDSNKDKYWEHDEIENNYKLHFIRFYEDEIIAIMFSSIQMKMMLCYGRIISLKMYMKIIQNL